MKNGYCRPISRYILEISVKYCFITMCKAHSKVVHSKIFITFITSRAVDIIHNSYIYSTKLCHYLTLNISETVPDTDIVTMEY